MSSILKALKKLESGTSQQIHEESWPQSIDPIKVINQRVKDRWLLQRYLSLTLIVVILIIGGWVVYRSPLLERKESSNPEPNLDQARIVRKTFPIPIKKEEKSTATELSPPPKPVFADKLNRPSPSSTLKKDPPTETVPEIPSIEDENPPVDQNHQSDLKVEAIVWSENPKSCFAVINGQIVKAGDSVEGARVIRIGRKSVSIRSSGKTQEIRFGLE
ncbi:hypothetical protein ACFL9T_10240 [Thermodesulfobacteriota bacterium]